MLQRVCCVLWGKRKLTAVQFFFSSLLCFLVKTVRPQKIARLRRSYSEGQSNPKIKQGKQRENSALHFALLTSNLTLRTGNEVDSRENTTILNL